ncbi:MAG: hypothetical protein IMZ44_07325 [Planctomycetes bacterium]|nr:hypothetical protein [Planctomycetota bacterium]
MPAIAETIFKKIEKAAVFIGDVTFVGSAVTIDGSPGKALPNPNVLVELGYAAKAVGWERIICVFNEYYGSVDDQIFNLKHRRNPIRYHLGPDRDDHASQQTTLSKGIETDIRSMLRGEHHAVDAILAQLDAYAQTFLRKYGRADVIIPRPTNVFTLGAPVGDLDTPSYNAAVEHLRQLGVIQAVADSATHAVTFRWTYMGYLVLQKLGLSQQIPEEAS